MSFFLLSYVLLWLVVAFESLVLILVLRELGVLYLGRREAFERDGPPEGKLFPSVQAVGHDGSARTLSDLAGAYRAVLFGARSCTLCGPAMEKFARWSSRVDGLSSVMLVEGQAGLNGHAHAQGVDASQVWWLRDGETFKTFGVRVSPFAVMVDHEGVVMAKGLVNHHGDIKRLIREARDSGSQRGSKRRNTNGRVGAALAPTTVDNAGQEV